MEKIKTYVLTLSKFFPSTHIRKGEPTSFRDAFNAGQVFNRGSACLYRHPKKHTIRSNYPLWLNASQRFKPGRRFSLSDNGRENHTEARKKK